MSAESVPRLGRYVDLTLLGQGGMGAVYRGRDPELDRPVAVKVMLDATPDFVARFRREAQAIARLTHPNIVQVYDFGVDEQGNPYFVMELVDGRPLDKIVRERGRLPPMEAMRLGRQAAEGLGAAHRAGIVHRDVKPSNLIVDGRGDVKLVDFGIARLAAGTSSSGNVALTGTAALMGTPGYMAPEQAQGKPVDARADIYALGLTLFEMLSGQPPYQADDPISLVVKNLQEPLPDLRRRTEGVPEELVQLIELMAEKDPERRLQSCDAVIAALDDVIGRLKTNRLELGVAPTALQTTDRVPPTNVKANRAEVARAAAGRSSRGAIYGGVAVLALALVGGGAYLAMRHPPSSEAAPPRGEAKLSSTKSGDVIDNARVAPPHETGPALGQGVRSGPLRVAVLKFQNVGKDPKLTALEQGIGESALTLLANASKNVTLVERADLDSEVKEIDRGGDFHFDKLTVAQAGKLEGIEYAVQGGFQKAGRQLRITARLVRVETGEIVGQPVKVTTDASDVFDAQDKVAAQLRTVVLALAEKEKR